MTLILNLADHYGEGSSSTLSRLYTYLIFIQLLYKRNSGIVALHYPSVFILAVSTHVHYYYVTLYIYSYVFIILPTVRGEILVG